MDEEKQGVESLTAEARPAASWKLSLVVSAIILAVTGAIATITFMTEPTAEREGATKRTPMLVQVVEVEKGTYRPSIAATGTVRAEKQIDLRPQVSGRVVSISENFVPGGFVGKGEVLVQLDATDYRNVLAQRKSALSETKAALAMEMGEQEVAKAEYKFLNQELPVEEQTLILRKPQLDVAKDRVKAAESAVAQARADLTRTTIRAPFEAHVTERMVNVGSQVSPNTDLGRLIGHEAYWVVVDLPLAKLRWVDVPENGGDSASVVKVRNRTAWPAEISRDGSVARLVGELQGATRMARILATISDPLVRNTEEELPRLMVGEFVEVTIEGREFTDVVRLDRDHVRDRDTVWTMHDGKLQVSEVEVLMRDAQYAYIGNGLESGDKVVTTHISRVKEGAPLRLKDER